MYYYRQSFLRTPVLYMLVNHIENDDEVMEMSTHVPNILPTVRKTFIDSWIFSNFNK